MHKKIKLSNRQIIEMRRIFYRTAFTSDFIFECVKMF